MNLQENIDRIKQMMGVITEVTYGNDFKRRLHQLDKLIDNLLPNVYPCDYNDEDDFFTGFYEELYWLVKNEEYELDTVDLGDIIDYIYQHKQEEIREYYRERCGNEEEETEPK